MWSGSKAQSFSWVVIRWQDEIQKNKTLKLEKILPNYCCILDQNEDETAW